MDSVPTILIVDDEVHNLDSLERIFKKEEMRVVRATSGKEAIEIFKRHEVDVVLTDLLMPGMSGVDLLKALRALAPEAEVVMMTAYGTVETAVDAMKEGAYDFVEKPLKRMTIVKTVRKALERRSLVMENRQLRQQITSQKQRTIVGNSPPWRRTLELASQAAPSMANVLIQGESGTGKEILARYIHDNSPRSGKAFVAVNCAAVPETIIEGEMFGYERGAFTGAVQKREGFFAQAGGGTLFLDEVGEVPPQVQVKLLRVIQEGEYMPLGGKQEIADVRLIAATNKDLALEVSEGRFREDLFYRLNVILIESPPLRHRRDDITLLADHFLKVFALRDGKDVSTISELTMNRLMDYSWPGNIRELENAIERAVVLARGSSVEPGDLPDAVKAEDRVSESIHVTVGTSLEDIERLVIRETLKHTGGDKKLAAHLLGIAPRTIYRKLENL
ncbi:MAG: sigma-54-dependent Fis family transcriptional regulator [Deltaproteobacteria bacterium]|nr:sigma-54-dependent Fis family transcriptional regulator [Deltaproteobacteria bacterium]